jgi:sporulation protein YlmC with PRC-barrel domain
MIRKLLATTAIVTVAAGSAYGAADRFLGEIGDAALASQLIGETVYASEAEDAETIGEVNDLIVANDGDIDAAVIGVGGFLGVGEKNVAVSFDSLTLVTDKDGDRFVVLETSKEELQNAPEFDVQAAAAPAEPAADSTAAAPAPRGNDMTAEAPQTINPTAPTEPPAASVPSRDTLKSMDVATISSDNVIGATIYSSNDESVGEISEVVLTQDGKIDAVVVDVGGFLGIGAKSVAIAFDALDFRTDENGNIYVYSAFTEDQLQAAAEYVKDDYEKNRDVMLLRSEG